MEVSSFVEGWVRGDQVHGVGVHGTEKGKVVSVKQGAVFPVGSAHAGTIVGYGGSVNYSL